MCIYERGRNTIIAFSVVVAVLVALLGLLYYNYVRTVNAKDSEISSLTSENEALKSRIADLTSRVESLQYQLNTLMSDKRSLEDRVKALESENSFLKRRVNDLEDIVYLRKTVVLERDKTVNLPARGYTTLTYSTGYAGYLRVSFTASGPIYFRVGSSFIGGYYYRYPESGTATSGSFVVPVLPGTTWIYIENTALLIGASVTFTIEYVY